MFQHFGETFVIGVSLAMDALAVSVALGAAFGSKLRWHHILLPGLAFGFFQAAMPMLGWGTGEVLGNILRYAGRIIATILLLWIGVKMIRERSESVAVAFTFRSLMVLACATSVDALMVGVSFSCLERGMTWFEPTVFGVVTAILSWSGVLVGRYFGNMLNGRCGLVGGLMLIAIAVKVAFAG